MKTTPGCMTRKGKRLFGLCLFVISVNVSDQRGRPAGMLSFPGARLAAAPGGSGRRVARLGRRQGGCAGEIEVAYPHYPHYPHYPLGSTVWRGRI